MLASGGMRSGAGKVSEREKVHYRRLGWYHKFWLP